MSLNFIASLYNEAKLNVQNAMNVPAFCLTEGLRFVRLKTDVPKR